MNHGCLFLKQKQIVFNQKQSDKMLGKKSNTLLSFRRE